MSESIQLTEVEKTELEFREGSSDKVYIARLMKQSDDLYRVIFKYGRRHNVHNVIFNPKMEKDGVPFGVAKAIYEEMVHKKLKKGYQLR